MLLEQIILRKLSERLLKKIELITKLHPMLEQPGIHDFMLLLVVCIEDWKTELIDAKNDSVHELQGAIKKVRQLIVDLKRDVIKQEYKDGGYRG